MDNVSEYDPLEAVATPEALALAESKADQYSQLALIWRLKAEDIRYYLHRMERAR